MISDDLLVKIEESLKNKCIKKEALTEYVTLLSFSNNKYIVKEVSNKSKEIYDYMASQKVENVLYPKKRFLDNKKMYFLFDYIQSLEYPNEKKILNLIESLDELHKKTSFEIKSEDINFKYFLRIYKRLDRYFQTLEMLVRECEIKEKKSDFEWVILSKYNIFLDAKKVMYQLQRTIHKYVDNKGVCIYSLNHGNPNLNHFMQDKLLSFENGYIGIFVSDFAKLYTSIDDINGEWFKELESKISSYGNDFYKKYFKFFVLYLYIINLRFTSFSEHTIMNTYIQIGNKISRFLSLTSNY